MLRGSEIGPVRFFSLARSVGGRYMIAAGVYFVDGLLIDTGPANAATEFASIIGSTKPDQVVLTHHHEDHSGNAAFAANHMDRPPRAHALTLPLVRKPPPLALYRRIAWGTPEPVQAEALHERARTPKHEFQVLHTPGHAPDHIALYEPRQKWLFAGDLFLAERQRLLQTDENITGIIGSLRLLLELPDCTLFCQHTGPHASHHESIGKKLDFLLGLQHQAVVLHDEGRGVDDIVAALRLDQRWWRLASNGDWSARNLIGELLRDAGLGAAPTSTVTAPTGPTGAAR